MERALARPDASPVALHGLARNQQLSGNTALAIKIFHANARRFPHQWPTNVGLARAYALSGDNAKAIRFARKAIAQAPDDANRKNLENLIQQWGTSNAAKVN